VNVPKSDPSREKMMKIQSIDLPRPTEIRPSGIDQLEQAFLEEMLNHGLPSPGGPFHGGAGEEQFSSFLTQQYAAILAARLDLGLGQGALGNA
jgi:flagellar protein FlgJ